MDHCRAHSVHRYACRNARHTRSAPPVVFTDTSSDSADVYTGPAIDVAIAAVDLFSGAGDSFGGYDS